MNISISTVRRIGRARAPDEGLRKPSERVRRSIDVARRGQRRCGGWGRWGRRKARGEQVRHSPLRLRRAQDWLGVESSPDKTGRPLVRGVGGQVKRRDRLRGRRVGPCTAASYAGKMPWLSVDRPRRQPRPINHRSGLSAGRPTNRPIPLLASRTPAHSSSGVVAVGRRRGGGWRSWPLGHRIRRCRCLTSHTLRG